MLFIFDKINFLNKDTLYDDWTIKPKLNLVLNMGIRTKLKESYSRQNKKSLQVQSYWYFCSIVFLELTDLIESNQLKHNKGSFWFQNHWSYMYFRLFVD